MEYFLPALILLIADFLIKKDVYQLTTATSEGTMVAYNIIKDWKSK